MDDPRRYLPLSPPQFHILLALSETDRHGYGIILDVARRTDGTLRLGTGTLYTALARLVVLTLVADADRADDRRRYYRLTPLGRAVLRAETARLETLVRHAHEQRVFGRRERPATRSRP
jgi:DNA-binding PadR family transcriptional regulator